MGTSVQDLFFSRYIKFFKISEVFVVFSLGHPQKKVTSFNKSKECRDTFSKDHLPKSLSASPQCRPPNTHHTPPGVVNEIVMVLMYK